LPSSFDQIAKLSRSCSMTQQRNTRRAIHIRRETKTWFPAHHSNENNFHRPRRYLVASHPPLISPCLYSSRMFPACRHTLGGFKLAFGNQPLLCNMGAKETWFIEVTKPWRSLRIWTKN
jgi:hypothetical protein